MQATEVPGSLMRDINSDLLKNPFDEGLKDLAVRFWGIAAERDWDSGRFGLKARFLRRHKGVADSTVP